MYLLYSGIHSIGRFRERERDIGIGEGQGTGNRRGTGEATPLRKKL